MLESIEWIMYALYGDLDLTFDQYNELYKSVTQLVHEWELKLA